MKIFLIGMPGSGKSTLGKQLSHELGHSFIDLDSMIEKKEGVTIAEIFQKKGEEYFRKLESDMLRAIVNDQDFVLATGGGTPCFHNNMDLMNHTGITVFINTSLERIKDRVSLRKHRPLFTDEQNSGIKVEELWSQRKNYYEQAHIVLKSMTPGQLAKALLSYKKN